MVYKQEVASLIHCLDLARRCTCYHNAVWNFRHCTYPTNAAALQTKSYRLLVGNYKCKLDIEVFQVAERQMWVPGDGYIGLYKLSAPGILLVCPFRGV